LPDPGLVTANGTLRGTLVLIVGPSGVGKDSLIAYCRSRLDSEAPIRFPRRTITRTALDETEAHDPVSEDAFRRHAAADGFALHWRAHGLAYGVPASIADDLDDGRHVVVNASRSIIDMARNRFTPLLVISVVAGTDALIERLHNRGREPIEEIRARLSRAESHPVDGPDVVRIENSGPLTEAGKVLSRLLASLPRRP
jgi:ribose 1,5-bisphosphokinase